MSRSYQNDLSNQKSRQRTSNTARPPSLIRRICQSGARVVSLHNQKWLNRHNDKCPTKNTKTTTNTLSVQKASHPAERARLFHWGGTPTTAVYMHRHEKYAETRSALLRARSTALQGFKRRQTGFCNLSRYVGSWFDIYELIVASKCWLAGMIGKLSLQ